MPAVNADVESYNQVVAEAEAKLEARRKRYEEESHLPRDAEAEEAFLKFSERERQNRSDVTTNSPPK